MLNDQFIRAALLLTLLLTGLAAPAADVLMWHNDKAHHGLNAHETVLTPRNVNDRQFGKLFSFPTDGYVYAQPLVVSDLDFPGRGKRTAVFVATEHDSVYAFDSSGNNGESSVLWHASFIDPARRITPVPVGDVRSQDLVPEIGITGTPVIDRQTDTLYVVARTKEIRSVAAPATRAAAMRSAATRDVMTRPTASQPASPSAATQPVARLLDEAHWVQKLHALDLVTGREKPGSPVLIGDSWEAAGKRWHDDTPVHAKGRGAGSRNGVISFSSLWEHQRPGLILDRGRLYIDYASHGDNGDVHGWVLAYDAHSLRLQASLCTTPDGRVGTSWMAGSSPAIDEQGNLYLTTGNGEFTAAKGGRDYGESVIRVATTQVATTRVSTAQATTVKATTVQATTAQASNAQGSGGAMHVADFFTPPNYEQLNDHDLDFGSGGIMLLPPLKSSAPTTQPAAAHRLIAAGKEGIVFLLDCDHLGGLAPSPADAPGHAIELLKSLGHLDEATRYECNIINTAACFGDWVYYTSRSDPVTQFLILPNGTIQTGPLHRAAQHFNFAPPTPSISSNGDRDGILWVINNGNPAQLLAYDAADVSHLLYDSNAVGSRDRLDGGVKFSLPTVADGDVFVGTQDNLTVFGLLPASKIRPADPTNAITTIVDPHHIDVSWQAHSSDETGFKIERSLNDGAFRALDTTGHGVSSYADRSVVPDAVYRYRITAANAAGYSHALITDRVTTPPAPPDPALIAHWAMDEGTGPRVADSTTQPSDGSIHGEVVWARGHVGAGALGFHGAGVAPGYVQMLDAAKFNFTRNDSFTLSGWAEPAAPPNKWAAIVARAANQSTGIGLWVDDRNRWCFGTPVDRPFADGATTRQASTRETTAATANVAGGSANVGWHLLVGVQDAAAKRRLLYVDGRKIAEVPGTSDANAAGDFWIGGAAGDETKYIDARIDDVRLYSRALSPADVATLFIHHDPAAPTNLAAEVADGKPTRLHWTLPPAEHDGLPTTIRLERSVAGGSFNLITRLGGRSDHAEDAALPPDPLACTYRVVEENSVGDSEPATAVAQKRRRLIRSFVESTPAHAAELITAWHDGQNLFVDRDFTVSSTIAKPNAAGAMPIDMNNAAVIRTANDDKHQNDYRLTYTLDAPSQVYLMIDRRTLATPGPPSGSEGFVDTHTQFDMGAPGVFEVFASHQTAGAHWLGSHLTGESFYWIAVKR